MWETNGGMLHKVNWGLNASNLNESSTATSVTSSGSNLIHQAILSGLDDNTRYYYQAISDTDSSDVLDFITPPLKSSEQSFNLIAMSDMQRDGSQANKFHEIVHDGIIDYLDEQNEHTIDIQFKVPLIQEGQKKQPLCPPLPELLT